MTKDNPGADEREAARRVRKFAEGDTINGAYRKMPIAAVTAFRDDLVLILAALQADRTARERLLEEAARVAEVYSSIHVEKRDDQMAANNMEGALMKARQAQTCDEIAAAIRALKDQPNDRT